MYATLAKAWVRISNDSITGNNMRGENFWQKVADFYNTQETVQRTWASLRGGYRVMNPACQNYLAILTRLENRQQSGAAPYDVVSLVYSLIIFIILYSLFTLNWFC